VKDFLISITQDHQVKGENLLLRALRSQKPGLYRAELYSLNKRSVNQNSYLHAVLTLCVKGLRDMGYNEVHDMEDAKLFYKRLYLSCEKPNVMTGEMYPVVRKTSSLSKDEMSEFIERIRENQLEFGGNYIPTADEYKNQHEKWGLVGLAVSLFFLVAITNIFGINIIQL
jgi:hypothetical protein